MNEENLNEIYLLISIGSSIIAAFSLSSYFNLRQELSDFKRIHDHLCSEVLELKIKVDNYIKQKDGW